MSGFVRWLRFNSVGALGFAVQLGSLAFLNRMLPGHVLAVSSIAVELAVLHNFVWHVRYTWRDRSLGAPLGAMLVRFQLANGAVSLLGNALLMRLLVAGVHVPVLAANIAASGCCSVLNFCLSDGWAFARA